MLLITALFSVSIVDAVPQQASLSEAEVKAAAFYNVISFTNWPTEAFASPEAPLVICIAGAGPIATVIDRMVQGESWRGRKIVVEHASSIHDLKPCHVVFIARSERNHWTAIRDQFANRPVLAVSDGDNFATQGGSVQLTIERNRLRILINLAVARSCKIQLSSNLLRLATIVGPIPDPIQAPHSRLPVAPSNWFRLALAVVR